MDYSYQNSEFELREQLVYAHSHGIDVDIEGISYNKRNPEEVLRIMERGNYMVDFEGDALGRIIAIHIDRVRSNAR
ncbi:MAG: hypothetical protein K5639_01695 [Eubacterium sp.]|nr:hypothetical protein [Eubacterium sp.]